MSFDAVTRKVGFCEQVYESAAEQSLDADISLPDYCPEIQRIIKCEVNANVTNLQNTAGRVTADANALIRIIYAGENGKVGCYEQSYPLQKFAESSRVDENDCVSVKVNTDYANCRAVSPRRVDVHAMLTFVFRATRRREEAVLAQISGDGIQAKSKAGETSSVTAVLQRPFQMSEVIELPGDKPSVFQLLNVSAVALADDVKVIRGKILLKGALNIKLCYIAEGNESVESLEHSMPISQIIEADGLEEGSEYKLTLTVASIDADTKADSSGSMRLIDVAARVEASVLAWESCSLDLITDSYSTDYETDSESRSIELRRYIGACGDTFMSRAAFDVQGAPPETVLCCWCSDLKYTVRGGENVLTVTGTYTANAVYRDKEGNAAYGAKTVDFEHSCKTGESAEKIASEADLQLIACSCSVAGEGKLEAKAELRFDAAVFAVSVERYIGNITVNDDTPKSSKKCALTVYFCGSGETVWDIAKHYNTTSAAIIEENSLGDEMLADGTMLMIPSV